MEEREKKERFARKHFGKIMGVLVLTLVLCLAWNVSHYYFNAANVSLREPSNTAQWWLLQKGLERAIANDTVGGDTPRATLDGYIAALEAGDIELAAKYYIPTKQAIVYSELLDSGKKNNLKRYVQILKEFSEEEYATSTNSYSYFSRSVEGMVKNRHTVVKNPITNKWKIAEP